MSNTPPIVEYYDLGMRPYREVWDLQKEIQAQLIEEKRAEQKGFFTGERIKDRFLFVEHPHVYTLGKSGDASNLLRTDEQLKQLNAEFVEIDRGGDITYHGPGQIVGYPILDLDRHFTDIHKYLRYLEEVIIRTVGEYGFEAGRVEGLTGVWVEGAKVCAMGIKCSRWVSMHGFALNVNTNMSYFGHIVPCGITDKPVCSLEQLCGRKINQEEVKTRILKHFSDIFEVKLEPLKDLSTLNV